MKKKTMQNMKTFIDQNMTVTLLQLPTL